MARRSVQISVKKKGDGVVVDGVTYTDRGTKFIQGSIYLDYTGLDKAARHAKMRAAIEKLTATS